MLEHAQLFGFPCLTEISPGPIGPQPNAAQTSEWFADGSRCDPVLSGPAGDVAAAACRNKYRPGFDPELFREGQLGANYSDGLGRRMKWRK